MELIWIGLGGIGGALTRYSVGIVTARYSSLSFPLATFLINITGAFLLGLSGAHVMQIPAEHTMFERYGFQIGFLGAYTTFSTFGYEAIRLLEDGEWANFFTYVLGSTVIGLLACGLGYGLGNYGYGAW